MPVYINCRKKLMQRTQQCHTNQLTRGNHYGLFTQNRVSLLWKIWQAASTGKKKKMQNRISLRLPFQFPGSHTFHQCPRFNRRHSEELGIQVVLRFSHLQNSIPNFVFINLSSEASAENSFSQGRHGNFPVIYAELELGIQTPELILFFPYFCSTIRSNRPVVVGVL